ncbi:MAG: Nramp family divalent metal transporter [Chitinophagaceae bacterium]|nr:Nramp family divalent metal transporter [Chitinophagaceae bacterium]
MPSSYEKENSLSEVHESVDTTLPKKGLRKYAAFIGPAYLVSVGYMDPGNWATDLQGGAKFGYQLIWVLLMSNLMALLLQGLSARLGIVRRRDLAQANREAYPPLINFCLYILAEIAIAACDLAEVLGMALGLHLLFPSISLLAGVGITVLDTLLLLWLQRFGIRKLEAFIIALVVTIGACFLIEIFLAKPDVSELVKGFVPTSLSNEALYIAVGIIGATVMPHNLYLHSALVQTRKIGKDALSIKKALKYNLIDSTIALNAAFFVNAAILVLAASVFFTTGNSDVAKIEDAHHLLDGLLGTNLAPLLFAVALIAAGQSSTVTGTLAGQIVMEGYLKLRINPWLRRLITRLIAIVPAVIVIMVFGDEKLDDLLVFSQVILSLQLGFAVIPLIHFVSDKKTMGEFTIKPLTQFVAWLVAAILVFLNVKMVVDASLEVFKEDGNIGWKITIIILGLIFLWLFLMMTFLPVIKKNLQKSSSKIHNESTPLSNLELKPITRIAVALDFTKNDERLIANALSQGGKNATYVLLHIVESASAKYLGSDSDDVETRVDAARLKEYQQQLSDLGYTVQTFLGYRNRIKEIVRIVDESNAELLIMGAHRHTGIKDYLFGETIDAVRHLLKIPVLIINVS